MKIFRAWFFRYLFSNYRWYRRWYGGRWERHYIEICHSSIWLDMQPDRKWPDWLPHSSRGTPIIEDYPRGQVPKPAPWPAPPGHEK